MRKLTTLLTTTALAVGLANFEARAQSTQPATTKPTNVRVLDRYHSEIPKVIDNSPASKEFSTEGILQEEKEIEINGTKYVQYENNFPKENELNIMFRKTEDLEKFFTVNNEKVTVKNVPTEFYVWERIQDKLGNAKTEFPYVSPSGEVQRFDNINLRFTEIAGTLSMTQQIEQKADSLPFIIIPTDPNQPYLHQDSQGKITYLAPNGAYKANRISLQDYQARKKIEPPAPTTQPAATQPAAPISGQTKLD